MRYTLLVCLMMLVTAVEADTRVNVVGLFSGKALLVINGGTPKTLVAGQTSREGVKLISADSTQAVLEIEGKRRQLGMGQGGSVGGGAAPSNDSGMTLYANSSGHFLGDGQINGKPVHFLVDTGATLVSMSSVQARQLGIDYIAGKEGLTSTAGGLVKTWLVTLNSVKLGGMTLNQVDCAVLDGDSPPVVLMGMSVLNRLDMKREGIAMTLTKKY